MPKRNIGSPSKASPKKSKTTSTSSSKTRREEEEEEIEPQVDIILEQLSSSSEEGEAGSDGDDGVDGEVDRKTRKSSSSSSSLRSSPSKKLQSPTKTVSANLNNVQQHYIVEEEEIGDDESSQQGSFAVNGVQEDHNISLNELKRKRSTSGSGSGHSAKREIVNPVVGVHKLKVDFYERVKQFYEEQTMADEQDDDDDEIVIDIATVKGFRLLYFRVPDEEAVDRKVLIDQFFRDYLLEHVVVNHHPWNLLLELSIKLAREEIASPGVPIALLTDLVELSILPDCEAVFNFIEQRLSIWKESLFDSCKHSVLRLCNDLLRRLSREQDTILCGKILIFLSNYFPFSERSGLNIMSEFNSENITLYKQGDNPERDDDPDDKMEIAEEKDEKLFEGMDIQIPGLEQMITLCQQKSKKGMQVDYNLYVKFWSLQDFFRNPVLCYNKLSWKTFTTHTSDVLQAYKCFRLDESSAAVKKRKDTAASESTLMNHIGSGESKNVSGTVASINVIPKFGDDTYFPKYLTNKRLLDLQMGDPNFRRYFLVQLLIVLQYLTLPVKFKLDTHVLTDEQTEFIQKTEEQIYEQLEQIPPNGADFVRNIKHIMKTEENWNKWKNDGCPTFKKPVPSGHPVDLVDEFARDDVFMEDKEEGADEPLLDEGIKFISKTKGRRELGDIINEATQKKRHLLGNPELTRLWNNCPDNLEACRAKERDFMPSIDIFFADAMKELDCSDPSPAQADTKKELEPKKILGDQSFGWRALRLLARRSPLFFQMHAGSPIHPLQNYLEYVLKKIAQELEIPIASNQLNEKNVKEETMDGNDDVAGSGENETENDMEPEDDDEEMLSNSFRTPKLNDDQSENKIMEL